MPKHTKSVSINEEDVAKAEERQQQKSAAPTRPSKEARPKHDFKLPRRYEMREVLGSGAYGCVACCKDLEAKRRVAIKQARHLFDNLTDAKRMLRELAILVKLDHPHVVRCYDAFVAGEKKGGFDELYIVLEVADSDLKKLLRTPVELTQLHVTCLLYNLLAGLNYLHSAGVWHRDLKPANCLVYEDCTVKLCDFGLARAVGSPTSLQSLEGSDPKQPQEKRVLTTHVVTRWYRAPELILLQESYTEAIDVWSAGCIYAELLGMLEGTKKSDRAPLFPGQTCFPLSPRQGREMDTKYYTKSTNDQFAMINALIGTPSAEDVAELEGDDARSYVKCFGKQAGTGVVAKFGKLDPVGSQLLERMLVFNARKRITVSEALGHPLFQKLRNPKLEKTASAAVDLNFERIGELDEKALRTLFVEELQRLKPLDPEVLSI